MDFVPQNKPEQLAFYLLVDFQCGTEYLKQTPKLNREALRVAAEDEDYLRLKSLTQSLAEPKDLIPYVKKRIVTHRANVEIAMQIKPDQDGAKVLRTLEEISDATDEEIIEALEIAKPTIPELLMEFESVRF